MVILSVLLFSCDKVSNLSDSNQIEEVIIEDVLPAHVILDKPALTEGLITIPVKLGKYYFPIKVKLDIKTSHNGIKILGIDNDGYIEFQEYSSVKSVYVVSESGLTKSYDIKLDVLPSNEISEIISFYTGEIAGPVGTEISEEGYPNPTNSTVTLFLTSSQFPLTIKPLIKISKGAKITGWSTGESITFMLPEETKKLKLISESGREEEWRIIIKNAVPDYKANKEELLTVYEKLNSPFISLNAQSLNENFQIDSVHKSSATNEITIFYNDIKRSFPADVKIDFQLKNQLSLLGTPPSKIFKFPTDTSTFSFNIIDIINGIYTDWRICLKPKSYKNILNSFAWNNYTSSDNLVTLEGAYIDNSNKIISIPVISNGSFPLTINGITVSSANNISSSIPSTITFASIEDFKVYSIEYLGLSEFWRIELVNNFSPKSNKADIIDFELGNTSYGYNISEAYIEPENSEIVILADKFIPNEPLKLSAKIKISENAIIEDFTVGGVLSLYSGTPVKLNVIAQNGDVKEWQIRLVIAPQIPNSDMEIWRVHPQYTTINTIFPSDGSGWNSSNNPSLTGVFKTEGFNSQYAAKVTTTLSSINFADIIKVTSLASGNLFLGRFRYSTLASDVYNPSSMTLFGIPFLFEEIPLQMNFMYKYHRGEKLQRTTPKISSTIIPAFNPVEDLPGTDRGRAFIELWNDNRSQLNASGEILLDQNKDEWTLGQINIANYNYLKKPNYIAVGFTASKDGELFTGADGSFIIVDEIKLIYHKQGKGSIKIK